jgi:hypothetical protein
MDIKSLEVNLLKASEIEDGDIVLIKVTEDQKNKLSKEDAKKIYQKITEITKKTIPIFFFPKDLNIQLLKSIVVEQLKNNDLHQTEESNES